MIYCGKRKGKLIQSTAAATIGRVRDVIWRDYWMGKTMPHYRRMVDEQTAAGWEIVKVQIIEVAKT